MKKSHRLLLPLVFLLLFLTGLACGTLTAAPAEPERTEEQLFSGVTYIREVRTSPRRMVIHVVKVQLTQGGVSALVTPPDRPNGDKPYNARTTSEFAREFKVQVAVNGGGFRPWYDYKLAYFPHSGDSVSPLGSVIYEDFLFDASQDAELPLVLFNTNRPVDIGYIRGKATYGLSGVRMLVDGGSIISGLNGWETAPRTALGNTKNGQTLIIVVIDGRQSGYSQGATLQELAQIMADFGAHNALEMDGGGSSTLVVRKDGNLTVLNSPIHRGIPGVERPVATHIGIKAK
jgi:hypothetical protein